MNMEENMRGNVDLLDSPLWQYLTRAATERFTYVEQASYMYAHLEWEKKYKEAGSTLEELKLASDSSLKSTVRRIV